MPNASLLTRLGAVVALSTLWLPCQNAPIGSTHPNAQPQANVARASVPAVDRLAAQLEDEQRAAAGLPSRFAIAEPVSVQPSSHGTWEALDAQWSLWRLRVQSPNASHLNLGFAACSLPTDAHVQLYSADGQHVVRPFTERDVAPTGSLWTPVVPGNDLVCELYVRTADRALVTLHLTQINSGYRFFGAGPTALSTDGSGSCNVDVNCPDGAAWQEEKSAVVALQFGGVIQCSGCMMNNTAEDGRNLVLTGEHCNITPGLAATMVTYFNYERATCGVGTAPLTQFSFGATIVAEHAPSDFQLLELNFPPQLSWGVSYAGWDRTPTNTTSATCIHHPAGDAKKISHDLQPTTFSGYFVAGTTHLRVGNWETGTTEGGSSGSPLFNQDKRVVGQLHGGLASCGNSLEDYYGRLSVSWSGGGTPATRLSDHLDPLGTGQSTLDTYTGPDIAATLAFGAGCYQSYGTIAEAFPASSFDLSGTPTFTNSIVLTPIADGYSVASGGNAWFTPVSANLGLGDDTTSQHVLPWVFVYPGNGTQVVRMHSNGFLWLSSVGTGIQYQPSITALATQAPRLCPLWLDFDPTAGGTCHYDVDPAGDRVYFTWLNVPAFQGAPGTSNTVQLVLHQSGVVEYRYRLVNGQSAPAVVGFTRGLTDVPPSTDLTTALPTTVTEDADPMTWTANNRPLLGSTQVLTLSTIDDPFTSIGLVVVGFTDLGTGIDLSFLGAAGCDLNVNLDVIEVLFPLSAPTTSWGLAIPGTPSLSGLLLWTQGVLLEPPGTANPAGIRTANGVELRLGTI